MLAAKRMKKKGDPGPPKNPHETYVDQSCATVGPMGCRGGAGFNVVGAAMAAADMIDKAVKGENVGQTLVTDPTQSEYKLYQQAKREREAKEAEKAAKAIAAPTRSRRRKLPRPRKQHPQCQLKRGRSPQTPLPRSDLTFFPVAQVARNSTCLL